MNATGPAETPAEMLARRIVARLVNERLIGEQDAEALRPKLAAGTLKAEDWSLPIELQLDKEGQA